MGDFGKSNFKAKSNAKEISVWTLGFSFFSPGFKRRWEFIV